MDDVVIKMKKMAVDKIQERNSYLAFIREYGDKNDVVAVNAKQKILTLKNDIDSLKTSIAKLSVDDRYEALCG